MSVSNTARKSQYMCVPCEKNFTPMGAVAPTFSKSYKQRRRVYKLYTLYTTYMYMYVYVYMYVVYVAHLQYMCTTSSTCTHRGGGGREFEKVSVKPLRWKYIYPVMTIYKEAHLSCTTTQYPTYVYNYPIYYPILATEVQLMRQCLPQHTLCRTLWPIILVSRYMYM